MSEVLAHLARLLSMLWRKFNWELILLAFKSTNYWLLKAQIMKKMSEKVFKTRTKIGCTLEENGKLLTKTWGLIDRCSLPPNWDGNFRKSFFLWWWTRWSHKSRFPISFPLCQYWTNPIIKKEGGDTTPLLSFTMWVGWWTAEMVSAISVPFCTFASFQKSNSLLSNIKLAFRFFVVQLLQFKTSSIAISQYQCMNIKLCTMHYSQGKFNLWALKNENICRSSKLKSLQKNLRRVFD